MKVLLPKLFLLQIPMLNSQLSVIQNVTGFEYVVYKEVIN